MPYTIRPYRPADRDRLKSITAAAFGGASIDKLLEDRFGPLGETDWAERKAAAIDADCDAQPDGILVAQSADGEVVGYLTTRLNRRTGLGWIANLAVDPAHQGAGLGRALLTAGLDLLRAAGMTHAKIETLASNQQGRNLYPSVGFEELTRQIHFAMDLRPKTGETS